MAKINVSTSTVNKDGAPIDYYDGNAMSSAYEIIPAGYYFGVVERVKDDTFKGKDGKHTFYKITPRIRLLNENGTIIDNDDVIVSAVLMDEKGAITDFIRVDGDKDKSAIWGGRGSAMQFFVAVGGLSYTEAGKANINVDTDALKGIVIKVLVETQEFKRKDGTTGRKNKAVGYFNPTVNADELAKLIAESLPDAKQVGNTLFVNQDAADAYGADNSGAKAAGYDW